MLADGTTGTNPENLENSDTALSREFNGNPAKGRCQGGVLVIEGRCLSDP